MTLEEFDALGLYDKPCMHCRRLGMARELNEHNQMRVICPHCGSKTPWGSFQLKQTNTKRRKAYPFGADLDEVWARYDNRCVVCSRTKDELKILGVGRQRQHVAPYVEEQHRGPIVPICVRCHDIATVLQRDAAVMRGFIRHSRSHDHDEPLSRGGARLPGDGLSPDLLRAEGQTPVGAVEGLSDDDADA